MSKRRGIIFSLLLSLFLFVALTPSRSVDSPAELANIPNVSIVRYSVTGSTAESVRQSLDANGPVTTSGQRADAYTQWQVSWRWPRTAAGVYALDKTRVTYSIKISLPEWQNRAQAAIPLQQEWDRYFRNLCNHEYQHVKNGLAARDAVESSLRAALALNPALTPDEANSLARQEIARLQLADRELDARSNHGQRDGVVFPGRDLLH